MTEYGGVAPSTIAVEPAHTTAAMNFDSILVGSDLHGGVCTTLVYIYIGRGKKKVGGYRIFAVGDFNTVRHSVRYCVEKRVRG